MEPFILIYLHKTINIDIIGVGKSFMDAAVTWLRSANNNNYYNANGLTADGVNNNNAASESHLVRPALHSLASHANLENCKVLAAF